MSGLLLRLTVRNFCRRSNVCPSRHSHPETTQAYHVRSTALASSRALSINTSAIAQLSGPERETGLARVHKIIILIKNAEILSARHSTQRSALRALLLSSSRAEDYYCYILSFSEFAASAWTSCVTARRHNNNIYVYIHFVFVCA
ncbi:unnamed protein product [Trichogramma brassicae]|uniref:Uncharacterized protein n=1 Tax=Trichogramma brassicae TaxID=86971 RepID=A0A6H5HXC9_9HYME|nr:unnamed protein product [Trichogramma brassicae]